MFLALDDLIQKALIRGYRSPSLPACKLGPSSTINTIFIASHSVGTYGVLSLPRPLLSHGMPNEHITLPTDLHLQPPSFYAPSVSLCVNAHNAPRFATMLCDVAPYTSTGHSPSTSSLTPFFRPTFTSIMPSHHQVNGPLSPVYVRLHHPPPTPSPPRPSLPPPSPTARLPNPPSLRPTLSPLSTALF